MLLTIPLLQRRIDTSFVCYALILGDEIDDIFYRNDFISPLVDHILQMSRVVLLPVLVFALESL